MGGLTDMPQELTAVTVDASEYRPWSGSYVTEQAPCLEDPGNVATEIGY
jgi:hypothetical protein